jgi:hypothetical protein
MCKAYLHWSYAAVSIFASLYSKVFYKPGIIGKFSYSLLYKCDGADNLPHLRL